jgi:pantetheine-phosphate adenylyltransferase
MTVALYQGSFDPITEGHLDIIARGSLIFEKLIVGVFATPSKSLLFSTQERVELVQDSVTHLSNVDVVSYSGLTVTFAQEIGAPVMVRGLRMVSDFDYEFEMAMMNKKLAPKLDQIFLMTRLEHQFISSGLIKEVAQLGGDVSSFVPKPVTIALKNKFQASASK